MKRILNKKHIAYVLAAALFIQILPMRVLAAEEQSKTKLWNTYTFISTSDSAIEINSSDVSIKGDIHSNGDFNFSGAKLNIEGLCETTGKINTNEKKATITNRVEKAESIVVPDLLPGIKKVALKDGEVIEGDKEFSGKETKIDKSIIAKGKLQFSGSNLNAKNFLFADKDININVSKLNQDINDKVVLCSSNGNINITASRATINGIIYAPNGTVTIDTARLTVKGKIIAKKIVYKGSTLSVANDCNDIDAFECLPEIKVDTAALTYDENTKMYFPNKDFKSLSGTISYVENAAYFSCTILDDKGQELLTKAIEAKSNWTAEGLGLVVGENTIIITAVTKSGKKVTEQIKIFNINGNLAGPLTIDTKDDDGDKLINYLEGYYGTDKNNMDTDNDGITDYQEIFDLGTNPLVVDTDGNGISDGDEDFDKDGVVNKEEYRLNGNPIITDTDSDGLKDGEEVKLGTALDKKDTDSDGLTDPEELKLGTSPLLFDTNSNGISDKDDTYSKSYTPESMNVFYDKNVIPTIDLTATGDKQLSFKMSTVKEDVLINNEIPGYIGSAYEFKLDGKFEAAKLTFTFNEDLLKDETFVPAIYYYNEEKQLLEQVADQVISGNTVSAQLPHFSKYILLNQTAFDAVWEWSIKPPADINGEPKKLEMALVIDSSGSMGPQGINNDPNNLRLEVSKKFVDKLRDIDKVAVMSFDTEPVIQTGFTSDKIAAYSAIDKIGNTGMSTNIGQALNTAISIFDGPKSENTSRYIILLTDGLSNDEIGDFEESAWEKGITVYTVGLGYYLDHFLMYYIAAITGGSYYQATVASDLDDVFVEIEKETIDYVTDSNNDGISDYYTKLMCEGKLVTGTGLNLFAGKTYEAVQANDDYDEDGLKNGEEVVITGTAPFVHATINSDPTEQDSDDDTYSDYTEIKEYRTDAIKSNIVMFDQDTNIITENGYYNADSIKDVYDNELAVRAGTFIGNKVFGSNYHNSVIYKKMLIEYFKKINPALNQENKDAATLEQAVKYAGGVTKIINSLNEEVKNTNDIMSIREKLAKLDNERRTNLYDPSKMRAAYFNDYIDDLNDKIRIACENSNEVKNAFTTSIHYSSDFVRTFRRGIKKVDFTLNLVQLKMTAQEAWDDYATVKANLQTLQDNVYILDLISQYAGDSALRSAANELREAVDTQYTSSFDKFMVGLEAAGPQAIGMVAHSFVGAIPVIGIWIELGISISDIILPISDSAEAIIKIYGAASTARILSEDFKKLLYEGAKFDNNDNMIYAFYGDDAYTAIIKYRNLCNIRITGESEVIKYEDLGLGWYKWIQDYLSDNREEMIKACNENINTLKSILYIYTYNVITHEELVN